MAKLVSKTYGDALFELAVESGQVDEMLEEARGIRQILRDDNELSKLMNHPKIVKEEKIEILEQIFKGRVRDEVTGLLVHYRTMQSSPSILWESGVRSCTPGYPAAIPSPEALLRSAGSVCSLTRRTP